MDLYEISLRSRHQIQIKIIKIIVRYTNLKWIHKQLLHIIDSRKFYQPFLLIFQDLLWED